MEPTMEGRDDDAGDSSKPKGEVASGGEPCFGVLLKVAYLGTRFAGFARQPNARTVQGELDGAVLGMDPGASLVRGASRTDSGVHSLAQPVAFDTHIDVPSRGWVLGLSRHTGSDVAVVGAARVPVGFDPRRHSLGKTYRYVICQSAVRDPFQDDRAWRVADRLNHERMRLEAAELLGRHDFRAFRTATDARVDTVRTIVRADVRQDDRDPRLLLVEVEGDRFLHRMVRIIVGALVDVGRERLDAGAITRALKSGDRTVLGITAPPNGLYLWSTRLDVEGQDKWPDHLFSR
jgi:tRNA pseudouridine38-40 synthase